MVAGLVAITPGSGYVDLTGAFFTGLLGGLACFTAVALRKSHPRLFPDDALDVFTLHGVGGIAGGLLTGLFATDAVSGSPSARGAFYGRPEQLVNQLAGILVTAGWSAVMTWALLSAIKLALGDLSAEVEAGLDLLMMSDRDPVHAPAAPATAPAPVSPSALEAGLVQVAGMDAVLQGATSPAAVAPDLRDSDNMRGASSGWSRDGSDAEAN